jgi:hypothetical protein
MQNLTKNKFSRFDDRKDLMSETMSVISKVSSFAAPQSRFGGQQNDKFRHCLKIWSGFTKYIKTQCDKNRIIDTLYFGTFYK